jgi:Flp pilus assembly protein TadD
MKILAVLGAMLLLAACAGQRPPERVPPPSFEEAKPEPIDPKKNLQIQYDLIRGLIDKGQYYAAIAHVEEQRQRGNSNELILLEADARRHLAQRQLADALYRRLLGTSVEGQALHGLGLLAAATDLDSAIRFLKTAAGRLPTDIEIRNDLGYALIEAGRYAEALPELSTAAELAPTQLKSRNNLIILMLLTGNQAGVNQLVQQSGTTPEALKQLKDQAQLIRNRQAARTKSAG